MAASVYIYSALGKFDYQFAHTVGQDFLRTAASVIGGLPDGFDEPLRAKLALMLPTIELIAGVGLLFPLTQRICGIIVIGMHTSLIAILGPWALGHSVGVIVWNAALIFQSYWWMVRRNDDPNIHTQPQNENPIANRHPISLANVVTIPIILFAMVAPMTERWGFWDHWLSWSLYSPHTSRVDVQIHRSAIGKLDDNLFQFVEAEDDDDGWQSFSMAAWSLKSRGVPIYPQSRYQMQLAIELAKRQNLDQDIRALERSMSNRWTGRRQETPMLGRSAFESQGRVRHLNRVHFRGSRVPRRSIPICSRTKKSHSLSLTHSFKSF